jgi:hypothetical protein
MSSTQTLKLILAGGVVSLLICLSLYSISSPIADLENEQDDYFNLTRWEDGTPRIPDAFLYGREEDFDDLEV